MPMVIWYIDGFLRNEVFKLSRELQPLKGTAFLALMSSVNEATVPQVYDYRWWLSRDGAFN